MIAVLTGSESYSLNKELANRINEFKKKYGDLALEQLDVDEVSSEHIFDAIRSLPLLASRKMIVLRRAAAQKEVLEKLADNPELVPAETDLLIVDSKLDKRARYFKGLKKTYEFIEFVDNPREPINAWIVEQVKEHGGTISQADAQYLFQRIGADKNLLANEVEKLTTYNSKIDRTSIDLLCEPLPQSTVFQLLDAAFAGNKNKVMSLYNDQRRQQVEPLAILSMIAWQLNILAVIKSAGNRTVEDVAKQTKLNPFVLRKSRAIADKMSSIELRKLVRRALELDVTLKSTATDADDSVQYFLLKLCRN